MGGKAAAHGQRDVWRNVVENRLNQVDVQGACVVRGIQQIDTFSSEIVLPFLHFPVGRREGDQAQYGVKDPELSKLCIGHGHHRDCDDGDELNGVLSADPPKFGCIGEHFLGVNGNEHPEEVRMPETSPASRNQHDQMELQLCSGIGMVACEKMFNDFKWVGEQRKCNVNHSVAPVAVANKLWAVS